MIIVFLRHSEITPAKIAPFVPRSRAAAKRLKSLFRDISAKPRQNRMKRADESSADERRRAAKLADAKAAAFILNDSEKILRRRAAKSEKKRSFSCRFRPFLAQILILRGPASFAPPTFAVSNAATVKTGRARRPTSTRQIRTRRFVAPLFRAQTSKSPLNAPFFPNSAKRPFSPNVSFNVKVPQSRKVAREAATEKCKKTENFTKVGVDARFFRRGVVLRRIFSQDETRFPRRGSPF